MECHAARYNTNIRHGGVTIMYIIIIEDYRSSPLLQPGTLKLLLLVVQFLFLPVTTYLSKQQGSLMFPSSCDLILKQ